MKLDKKNDYHSKYKKEVPEVIEEAESDSGSQTSFTGTVITS